MITKVYKDYNDLSAETAVKIAGVINTKPDALLCFPAGETSVGTFKELIRLQESGLTDFSRCRIVGLDEWVHLGKMKSETCYNFLKSRLFDRLPLDPLNMHFFNGEADDLELECRLTDEFISQNGGIDMMLLGVGMNGHLGLNEPGSPADKYSHIVELDDVTKIVGQKYFSEDVILSQGITLGMKNVMETTTVIVQLSGKKKSPVVKHLLEAEASMDFPVSMIKKHPNAFLLLDSEASQY